MIAVEDARFEPRMVVGIIGEEGQLLAGTVADLALEAVAFGLTRVAGDEDCTDLLGRLEVVVFVIENRAIEIKTAIEDGGLGAHFEAVDRFGVGELETGVVTRQSRWKRRQDLGPATARIDGV